MYLVNKIGKVVNSQRQAEGRNPAAGYNGVNLELYASYELIACAQKLMFGISWRHEHSDGWVLDDKIQAGNYRSLVGLARSGDGVVADLETSNDVDDWEEGGIEPIYSISAKGI